MSSQAKDLSLQRRNYSDRRSNTVPCLSVPGPTPVIKKTLVYDNSDLTLKDLLARHSNSFPLQFVVTKGFLDDSRSVSINEGDLYTAYFEKRTDVIAVRDYRGEECSLPVNSAVQLGLIYDPNNSLDEALIGYEFSTVRDVMKAPLKPTILRVTQTYKDSKDSKSVERDELLLIKQCVHARFNEYMEVYSVTQRLKKKLRPTCLGRFTTNPHRVAMYAAEILEHVPNVCGTQALMISDAHSVLYSSLPQQFVSEPVSLLRTVTESSLIAKPAQDIDQAYRLVEIPTTLDITVKIVPPGSDKPSPKRDTLHAVQEYKFRRVRTIDKSPRQRAFREAVRQGFENTGVSLQLPPKEDLYESIDENVKPCADQEDPKRRHTVGEAQLTEEYVRMVRKEAIAPQLPVTNHDSDCVPSISPPQRDSLDSQEPQETAVVSEKACKNKAEIANFSCAQVLDLLDKMKLSQYKPVFEEESMTGKLLLGCDDDLLKNDLGVKSRLHRIRLMQLISGETSVSEVVTST